MSEEDKEVKSLSIVNPGATGEPGEEGKKPTYDELVQEVRELKQAVQFLAIQQSQQGAPGYQAQPPQPQDRRLSPGAQKICDDAEVGKTPDQLKRAERWVVRQMGGRLRVQQGPVPKDGSARPLEVVFQEYTVTQEHRDRGITNLPDGWYCNENCGVYSLARYFIDIILDMESYKTDAEKLLAVIADSEKRNTHTAWFKHLFQEDGVTLKPLRRRRKRKGQQGKKGKQ